MIRSLWYLSAFRSLVAVAAGVVVVVGMSDRARATELRSYTDDDGVTHLIRARPARRGARAANATVPSRTRGPRPDPRSFDPFIRDASGTYDLPEAFVRAIIAAESNFNPDAVSSAGARGLMQLMPGTASDMHVGLTEIHVPDRNIEGGTRYLRVLANMFGGDPVKTVAAYNAGPEAVRRHGGVPPYPETQAYVRRVTELYRRFSQSRKQGS